MPDNPNCPGPVAGGMNCPSGLAAVTQWAWSTCESPTAMKSSTMPTLSTTKAALTRADASMPT